MRVVQPGEPIITHRVRWTAGNPRVSYGIIIRTRYYFNRTLVQKYDSYIYRYIPTAPFRSFGVTDRPVNVIVAFGNAAESIFPIQAYAVRGFLYRAKSTSKYTTAEPVRAVLQIFSPPASSTYSIQMCNGLCHDRSQTKTTGSEIVENLYRRAVRRIIYRYI